jgi:hypothetical protein
MRNRPSGCSMAMTPDGEPFGEVGVDDRVDGSEWVFPAGVAEF